MRSSVEDPDTRVGRRELLAPHVSINGVSLHTPTAPELEAVLRDAFEPGPMRCVSPINGKDLARARTDRVFRGMLERMDLRVPEANTASFFAWLRRQALPADRLRTDLLHPVLSVTRDLGRSVYFLGGKDTEPFEWATRARRLYRGLRLAGAHAPGADLRDAEGGRRLVQRLNDSGAQVIVALPATARGEEFSFRYASRLDASLYLEVRHGPRPLLARDVPCGGSLSPVARLYTRRMNRQGQLVTH